MSHDETPSLQHRTLVCGQAFCSYRQVNVYRDPWESAGAELEAVEATMRRLSEERGGELLGTIAVRHLASGGKRIRARLALAACEATGGTAARAVGWGAACELFHNATLIHDDLQDGDDTRRGHPTVWREHGMPQAINAGDLLLLLPILAVGEVDAPAAVRELLCMAMARHGCAVIRGQAFELAMAQRGAVSWNEYEQTVVGKTSGLFELPVEGGALLAGISPEGAAEISAAFRPLGVLFQMQDDLLDLYGDKGRAAPGSDIREGKISALVVEHLALHPADTEWLLRVLGMSREETPDEEVIRVIHRFRDNGALAAVARRIEATAAEVRSAPALARHPPLAALAERLIEKVLAPVRHVM
jgi:geranylgeranyl pyrophosphate synthase